MKIKIPKFYEGEGITYNDVSQQQDYVTENNNNLYNQAVFFQNVKPWWNYATDVIADVASMYPRPEVQVVADTYQGDTDGLVRDAQQIAAPYVKKKITQTSNRLIQTPDPPRRTLPLLPGETPRQRQIRQAIYNRTHPLITQREGGHLLKGAGKLIAPYRAYLMWKDLQQLWQTVKNYPRKNKDGFYKYNKNK